MNDFSHAVWVYLLKDKIEMYDRFVSFCSMVKTQFDKTIQMVHSDNGTEFTKGTLPIFLSKKGIIHETFCVDTPNEMDVLKRKIGIFLMLPEL